VARDRQRSKQRRKRAAQGGGNPAGSRAADIGLDDATIDESGLTDTAPAPDPLKNASPDADQARAATTGAGRGEPGEVDLDDEDVFSGEDELERAPDEVETPSGLRDGRRRGGAVAAGDEEAHAVAPATHKERGRVLTFLRACVEELRRVQWPDRKHVFQATAVVLGFVLLAGGYLGLLDALFQPLINAIL
jgi:preprotein translocase SecE subunit